MHLSLLCDGYLSDSLADAEPLSWERDLGRVHRDGLLRGLLFAAALALPLGLTALASSEDAGSAPPVPTHLHVSHLHLS